MRAHHSFTVLVASAMLGACGGSGGGEPSSIASSDLGAANATQGGSVDGGRVDAGGGEVCPSGGQAANANHVCSSDTSWKAEAEQSCQAQGFELGSFDPDEYCGKGSSDSVTWTCCVNAPPPSPTCSVKELTAKACTEDSALRAQATASCKTAGDVLQTFVASESCASGSSQAASYTCCPYSEPSLPAFPLPTAAEVTGATWAFYDNPQPTSVFKDFQPLTYLTFSARTGQTFTATLTAMVSSEDWQPDPSKGIDGAILEGELVNGRYEFTQIARGSSEGGVLDLTARSGGSDRIHLVAFEASAASYPKGTSPEVSASLDITCATGDHADCALGGEPGDSCTISPATCDGPVTWCFSPQGQCSNKGTCQRIDIECPFIREPVCTCSGVTEQNACWATVAKQSIAYDGVCQSETDGGSVRADGSAPPTK